MSESQKRIGRPPGTGAPPEGQRKPRSVRLNDKHWAKFKTLGPEWLERAIDAAPDQQANGITSPLPTIPV